MWYDRDFVRAMFALRCGVVLNVGLHLLVGVHQYSIVHTSAPFHKALAVVCIDSVALFAVVYLYELALREIRKHSLRNRREPD